MAKDYLVKRGDKYSFRMRIPEGMREAERKTGQTAAPRFWQVALGTGDRRQAERLAQVKAEEYRQKIEAFRNPPLRAAVARAADRFKTLSAEQRLAIQNIIGGGVDPEWVAAQLMNEYNARLETAVAEFQRVGEKLRASNSQDKATRDIEAYAWDVRAGKPFLDAVNALSQLEFEIPGEVSFRTPAADTLKGVYDAWAKETDAQEHHRDHIAYCVRRWTELHGALPLNKITKTHVRAYKEEVQRLPRTSKKEFRGLELKEAIIKGEAEGLPTITAETANRLVMGTKTLLSWGFKNGYLETDPGHGITPIKSNPSKGREEFSEAELKTLLVAVATIRKPTEDDFWIPIVSLYTGARLEEVCQLRKEDVIEEGGIWCIKIHGEDGRRIKNENSERIVPVHKTLIDAGWLAHVKRSPGPLVFSTLETGSTGRYSDNYRKRFSWLLRKCAGIKDTSLTFHSLRHSFITACKRVPLPYTVECALAGHGEAHSVHGDYGSRAPAATLNPYLQQLDFGIPVQKLLGLTA